MPYGTIFIQTHLSIHLTTGPQIVQLARTHCKWPKNFPCPEASCHSTMPEEFFACSHLPTMKSVLRGCIIPTNTIYLRKIHPWHNCLCSNERTTKASTAEQITYKVPKKLNEITSTKFLNFRDYVSS